MIRHATSEDMKEILRIYEIARTYMQANGNPTQWGNTYPEENLLLSDIEDHTLYVCATENHIYGVFKLMDTEDPCYLYIENGAWKNALPYSTIHRIASDGTTGGVFKECIDFSKNLSSNLRIDTHLSNLTMQHLIEKNGFEKCGTVYMEDHTPRIAYQFTAAE